MTDCRAPSHRTADEVARASYGRLLARLARQTRDIATAEEALSEALLLALEHWPRSGVPDAPEAWLLTTARRRHLNIVRHATVRSEALPALTILAEEQPEQAVTDRRLELLFVCGHPAIDPAVRTPLMLQTVLGLSAKRIAEAFATAPATMSQQLVRAKAKIREAGLTFAVPGREALPERMPPVLDAIYAAFGTVWAEPEADLAREALFLADLLATALPEEPEPKGLLALILFVIARAPARGAGAAYVPLEAQDTTLWDRARIAQAEALLAAASEAGRPGRYQIEAALQSLHMNQCLSGVARPGEVLALYDLLAGLAPSLAVSVNRAAALTRADRPEAALSALDALPDATVAGYQPFWATLAETRRRLGQTGRAVEAYDRAIDLAPDAATRSFLEGRRGGCAPRTAPQNSRPIVTDAQRNAI
ncbi:MAG: DUF6596 domain-containing protein [Pseudomonadota bacterium]